MSTPSPFFQSIEFSNLTLRVRNLEHMLGFYRDALGMKVVEQTCGRAALSATGASPALIVLEAAPEAPPRAAGTAGLFHVTFLYPDRAALGRIFHRLAEAGASIGGGDHGVSEALYLADPEGNGVELAADRPPAVWPKTAGADAQLAMGTDPVDFDALIAVGAQASGQWMPENTRIGHVHLSVSNLAAAEAFYADVLGFQVRQRLGQHALFLARDGYHHHLGLNTWQSSRIATPGATGLARFTIRFREGADLDMIVARVDPGRRVEGTGVVVRDGDGIELALEAFPRGA